MDDYGFSDDYPLQEKLDEALFWYAAYRERKPTARSQHKKLDTLSKRAIKLLDAIADLDGEDFAKLESYYPLLSERENINGTLRAIRNAAEFAENDIPKGKAGKPENIALHGFIRRLNRIFTEGTGKQRKYTFDEYTNTYTGLFFDFADKCLQMAGEKLSNDALGKAIKKAFNLSEKK